MTYEEWKTETAKQISLNTKYFKGNDFQILHDFLETVSPDDFPKSE